MNESLQRVRLEPISRENWEACARLQLNDDQSDFLPSPLHCIAELQFWPDSLGFSIYAGNRIIGLTVFGIERPSGSWKIFRFMVDKNFQQQGFGRAGMCAVIREIERTAGKTAIRLCYHPRNDAARKLYNSLGFTEIEHQPCMRSPEGKILAIRAGMAANI